MERSLAEQTKIAYLPFREGWTSHADRIKRLIEETGATRVCDVGGGANPIVPLDFVERRGLTYVLLDVSASELDKAPGGYAKVVADITGPKPDLDGSFDLVVTRMLAEHVRDPGQFHTNVRSLMKDGGRACHFFPTLYSLPFVLNRALPAAVSDRLLHLIQSGRDQAGCQGKFPAFYRWCRGPTRRQIQRLEAVGYLVEEYVGIMGHQYYRALPPLQALNDFLTRATVRWPNPEITSYSWVVLRRRPLLGETGA